MTLYNATSDKIKVLKGSTSLMILSVKRPTATSPRLGSEPLQS